MIFEHRIHSNNMTHYDQHNKEEEQGHFTSYLLSIFESIWSPTNKKEKTKKKMATKGLQPRTAIVIAQVHTMTEPITIEYRDNNNDDDYDYLSKSDSTQSSFGSSLSSSSSSGSSSSSSSYNDDSLYQRSHQRRKSSIALSEILCEHYVQLHSAIEKHIDVPLETFKTFQALDDDLLSDNNCEDESCWFMGNTNPKQWVLVDELLRKNEQKEEEEEPIVSKKTSSTKKSAPTRAIRTNSDHLRMIVAEVNMMRTNKIICPLKPRGFLPARTDTFIPNTPSPLSALSFI